MGPPSGSGVYEMVEDNEELSFAVGIAIPPKEFNEILKEAPIVPVSDAKAESIKLVAFPRNATRMNIS